MYFLLVRQIMEAIKKVQNYKQNSLENSKLLT